MHRCSRILQLVTQTASVSDLQPSKFLAAVSAARFYPCRLFEGLCQNVQQLQLTRPPENIRCYRDGLGKWMNFVPSCERLGTARHNRTMGYRVGVGVGDGVCMCGVCWSVRVFPFTHSDTCCCPQRLRQERRFICARQRASQQMVLKTSFSLFFPDGAHPPPPALSQKETGLGSGLPNPSLSSQGGREVQGGL